MAATVQGIFLGPDTHANRPAANAAGQPIGSLYMCTTHNLLYETDGSAWTTYAAFGFASPMTTRGDLITGGVSGAVQRYALGTVGKFLRSDGTDALWASLDSPLGFLIDGGGATITTGVKGFIEVPFAATIVAVRLFADQSGSIVVDLWKDTYANYPPTVADTITASAKPTISTATKSQDTTLTGWTTSVAAGDIIGFNVDSVTTCQRVTVALTLRRV